MPDNESATTTTTVQVLKQNWSEQQIEQARTACGLDADADLLPDHFAQAGITEPENGTEVHTFTITEGQPV